MNRRDFLHPRRLVQTAGQVLGALGEPHPAADTPSEEGTLLVRLARRAMATTFEIVFPFGTSDATRMGEAALDLIDGLENQLTAYRDGSEVCRLNRLAPAQAVPVEAGLFGLLQMAARITGATGGAFDVTAGALIKAWGFFRGPKRVPSDAERAEALGQAGMHWVELRPEGLAVRYLRPRLEINLGAIGKGYALDRASALLAREWECSSVLLHGGHSSVYARGCPPGNPRGWPVTLRHPWRPQRLALVWLHDRALGTSAATFQHLEYNGKKLGHVLDPRTGWPAEGIASASVLAPTGAEADALSTAFFVGGVETARRYCEAHPEVGAILLPEGDAAEPVVFGLAPHEIDGSPSARCAGRAEP
jgi:thiamine biosynthesis lipoprotein